MAASREVDKGGRRSETSGLLHFGRDMVSALAMALIAIVYVIQAFRIPTGSMEKSLLVGDFLLGLKFVYGAPLLPFDTFGTFAKFPALADPKPGDVVIFKYPGTDRKDYIKRCVAGPGQTVKIKGKNLYVDGKEAILPPRGQHIRGGRVPVAGLPFNTRLMDFKPLRIPASGDTIRADTLEVREFHFLKQLVQQEHPLKRVRAEYQFYLDGGFVRSFDFEGEDNWTRIAYEIEMIRRRLKQERPDAAVEVRKLLYLGDERIQRYVVKNDNYFMMGDNRDNSTDSRFWGYLNRRFVKAKAFILYFSLDKDVPFFLLPLKIRWGRIGMLIRSWDGGIPPPSQSGMPSITPEGSSSAAAAPSFPPHPATTSFRGQPCFVGRRPAG